VSLPLPHTFGGRYRLERRVGAGSFAVTYEATDLALGRKVAVKVLRDQYAGDPRLVARFEREARAAAAIINPYVVSVFDYGHESGTEFLVMELVDGGTLKDLIQDGKPPPAERAIDLTRQILRGLAAIHAAGIVHRDVKPRNVLLTSRGSAKLSDFGIARGNRDRGLTEKGMALGTAAYMAPEQAYGEDPTPATDIYAVGVVLFELLTGDVPFSGDNAVNVMYRQVNEEPPPVSVINPTVPIWLNDVVLRAMAKDPVRRFSSAEEMLEALDGVPVSDPDASTRLAGAIPAGAAGVATAAATSYHERHRTPPRRVSTLLLATGVVAVLIVATMALVSLRNPGSAKPTPTPTPSPTTVAPLVIPGSPTATTTPHPTVTVTATSTATPSPTTPATAVPTATTPPAATSVPTADPTAPAPTPTPSPTAAPAPTPTKAAPPPTAVPKPTPTPLPTKTVPPPAPIPVPTPTGTPRG